jgi:hypothetical protein
MFKPNVVVVAVPYLLGHAYRLRDLIQQDAQVDEELEFKESESLKVPAANFNDSDPLN